VRRIVTISAGHVWARGARRGTLHASVGTEIVVDTVVASLAFCAVMAAALGYQWRTSRQAYLGCWAAFWSLYVVVWAVVVPAYGDGAGPGPWIAVAVATGASLLGRSLLALGTALHVGKALPSRRALAGGALAVLALAGAVTAARAAADVGAVPRWAVLPFRPYFLGVFLNLALAILLLRWRRRSPAKGRLLLALAFVAGAASDAWDVALELARQAGWVIPPDLDLRLSAIGAHLCDALFAIAMMVAAIATERERAETAAAELRARDARLLHAERLETVGQLAGGLAHDFNNLLTAILASLSVLRERTPPGDPALEDLDIATGAADRASRLTRQLLTFARRQPVEPRRVDLNAAVTAAAPLLASLTGTAVARRVELAAAPWTVRIDPVQLEQALVNIVVNARDAMPDGGALTLSTANVTLGPGPRPADASDVPAGEWVRLSVEDTGEGMDAATRARVFEPFFTTKPVGKGNGLGLATVHGVVRQAGGHVGVWSEPGHGTRFTLWLPRAHGAPDRLPAVAPAASGIERVLLVEDDPVVRSAAQRGLAARGFRVTVAEDGRHALDVIGDGVAAFDVLVTDVVMPRVDGRALASALRTRRPGLPVLFVTGYAAGVLGPADLGGGPTALLLKPFAPDALAARLRELLDGVRASPP
jgi:signal transduction histidine kinase/CheY-like chemotaxis protein